ncbi:hypothetical protein FA15DRAFT_675437 [Coprinopsis marcescibilis]|uniref:Uncharacterized protein n=1 Tax=Coprinopsis marcescibilis TaxID=230819 RepID=A0A5C3KD68_COPMA|nr:hypothetical protein FA15DRAFT_675621 [Coprinopsis marcescibilis]TFK18229.1 hypothetical protein FA15DRAFT_675437 [Coprinopsis marcescibilis]
MSGQRSSALSIREEGTEIYQIISTDSDKEGHAVDLEAILSLNLFSLCLENVRRPSLRSSGG